MGLARCAIYHVLLDPIKVYSLTHVSTQKGKKARVSVPNIDTGRGIASIVIVPVIVTCVPVANAVARAQSRRESIAKFQAAIDIVL